MSCVSCVPVTHRVSVFMFLCFCITSSHSLKPNMLFPEYHNRFRYTGHVSLRKWVFINQQEIFLLSFSKKNLKKMHVHCTRSCVVNSLDYWTWTTVSLISGYIANLSDFYSYRIIGKLTVFLQVQE